MAGWTRHEGGQASFELVALLALIVLVALALLQAALVGWTAWSVGGAARAAARAHAVGTSPAVAARRAVPPRLRPGLVVRTTEDGVLVLLRAPALVGAVPTGHLEARARFTPQGGAR